MKIQHCVGNDRETHFFSVWRPSSSEIKLSYFSSSSTWPTRTTHLLSTTFSTQQPSHWTGTTREHLPDCPVYDHLLTPVYLFSSRPPHLFINRVMMLDGGVRILENLMVYWHFPASSFVIIDGQHIHQLRHVTLNAPVSREIMDTFQAESILTGRREQFHTRHVCNRIHIDRVFIFNSIALHSRHVPYGGHLDPLQSKQRQREKKSRFRTPGIPVSSIAQAVYHRPYRPVASDSPPRPVIQDLNNAGKKSPLLLSLSTKAPYRHLLLCLPSRRDACAALWLAMMGRSLVITMPSHFSERHSHRSNTHDEITHKTQPTLIIHMNRPGAGRISTISLQKCSLYQAKQTHNTKSTRQPHRSAACCICCIIRAIQLPFRRQELSTVVQYRSTNDVVITLWQRCSTADTHEYTIHNKTSTPANICPSPWVDLERTGYRPLIITNTSDT